LTASAALQSLKDRHRTTWAAGDYGAVADALVLEIGERIVERVGPGPESEVLDVATGTGSAAIPAALRGARVVGLDLVPDLLAVARGRAADAGVDVEWIEGDAEDLPFADGSFDVVLSTLGVQFTPRHEDSARELVRVCRPGGTIAVANWTPQGYIGRFFKTLSPYMPPLPEGASPPPLWGDEGHVERLLGGAVASLEFERSTVDFVHESPEAFIAFMAGNYGPLVMARRALTPQGRWEDLRRDLIELSAAMNLARDGRFRVPSEYLVAVART
jgi:ubiquinone/menaquinone biosynthesis C-methylase UbiE